MIIEYIDESHTYLIDGIIVPSVSQLCQFATKKDFSKVNKKVLQLACEFGTEIHKDIELYETQGIIPMYDSTTKKLAFSEYLRVKDIFIQDPTFEGIITYKNSYAGRFDCLDNGFLIDFKTNSVPDIEWLQWQLGYYKMALEEQGKEIKQCYCLSIPRLKSAKWIEIQPKTRSELQRNLKEYEKQKKSGV